MSDHERFAQVAHDNERMSKSLVFSEQFAHMLFRTHKTNDLLNFVFTKMVFFTFFNH